MGPLENKRLSLSLLIMFKFLILICLQGLYMNGNDGHEHPGGLDLVSSKFTFGSVLLHVYVGNQTNIFIVEKRQNS